MTSSILHIDDDRDVQYHTTSTGYFCRMNHRIRKTNYKLPNGAKYDIVGCMTYDIQNHPLYKHPTKQVIRAEVINIILFYQKKNVNNAQIKGVEPQHIPELGGWFPSS